MKFVYFLLALLILTLIGGFVYITMADVQIERQTVRQPIPSEQMSNQAQPE